MTYSNSIHQFGEKIKGFFIKHPYEFEFTVKNKIGEIQYKNDEIGSLILSDSVKQTYEVNIKNKNNVAGIYINSHRPTFPYRMIKEIPTYVMNRYQIYKEYFDFTKRFVFDTFRDPDKISATCLIK